MKKNNEYIEEKLPKLPFLSMENIMSLEKEYKKTSKLIL
jgi:hypothetical protein